MIWKPVVIILLFLLSAFVVKKLFVAGMSIVVFSFFLLVIPAIFVLLGYFLQTLFGKIQIKLWIPFFVMFALAVGSIVLSPEKQILTLNFITPFIKSGLVALFIDCGIILKRVTKGLRSAGEVDKAQDHMEITEIQRKNNSKQMEKQVQKELKALKKAVIK
ncbi:MAG: hypothetical protein HQL32_09175 [Planctomycetes bacterium]|nr:hypothetical protein [Planctomycetota bacterium]